MLSPDGRRVSFARFLSGGLRDIFVRDLARDTETRLTFDGDSFNPVWSPDGRQIAFSSSRQGVPDVYVTNAVGGGSDEATRVTELTPAVDIPPAGRRTAAPLCTPRRILMANRTCAGFS